ncbi:sarcosine oxidase subunit gamma [Kushneria marisflavi]|uniref:Sarcosine oxidase subunit gamma n=1 Tax=Kushneria marisflavi TaxID=157779 RepID=A0A240UMR4_9GAMM|nr:sarcosine oxidase subunit gamma family protein [Kushneria marisflavi]ART62797.1 sarcosine oxidase subunit gamma [Kushneria marisflavi]RKD83794.1 heterotetrameric sarcosine oxidase gamma subunit [Kushneria marisflavi]
MSDVKEFETRPADTSKAESPLAWSVHEQKSLPHASNPGVIISEKPFLGQLILRGGAIVMDEAIREVMGIALPAKPLALVSDDSGERSIQWLSPDEWLVIVPGGEEFELEQKLRQSLGQAHFSIVNVSGGQTVVSLKGNRAREVLMKSISYDVHPHAFPVGKGVSTVFAKATVILRRAEEDGWELVIRRSFADYCYRWLLDASREYGVSVTR